MSAGHRNTEAPSMRGDSPGCRNLLPRTVQQTLDGNLTFRRKAPRRIRAEIGRLGGRPRDAAFAGVRVARLRRQGRPETAWMPWARRYWKLYRRMTIEEKRQTNGLHFDVPWVFVPVPKGLDCPWLWS